MMAQFPPRAVQNILILAEQGKILKIENEMLKNDIAIYQEGAELSDSLSLLFKQGINNRNSIIANQKIEIANHKIIESNKDKQYNRLFKRYKWSNIKLKIAIPLAIITTVIATKIL